MYQCKECGKTCNTSGCLTRHINVFHNAKTYYDKWIKQENDDICKFCHEKETLFVSVHVGYKECCCKKHTDLYAYEKRKKKMLEHYGVENSFQLESSKESCRKAWIANLGVSHPMQSQKVKDKIKETLLSETGFEHQFCKNSPSRLKWETTLFNEKGVTNVFQLQEVKDKIKQTNIRNTGYENPMQDPSTYEKAFKTRILIHNYLDSSLTYQASYEKDFLDIYYDKIIKKEDLFNGPTIPYFTDIVRAYHSDFYIKSLNLVIEIKSSSTLLKQSKEEIVAKENCVLNEGYNFIMILDKNYENFNKWLNI